MTTMAPPGTRDDSPVIVCALDDNYSMCLAAMLKSLEENLGSGTRARVFLLQRNVSESHKQRIEATLNRRRLDVTWTPIDDSRVKDLKVDRHISTATYYRLLIEDSLPHLHKAIYIDCDAIITEDVQKLWTQPFDGAHLLAVPQLSPDASLAGSRNGLRAHAELGIAPHTRLFNAGVLLMNLSLWRKDEISDRVIRYLNKYETHVLWWDQDGLNAILPGKWRALDSRWNLMISLFRYYSSWRESPFGKAEYYRLTTQPYIVHYNSISKPWQSTYALPFKDLFFRYLDKTAWKDWRP
jgi:lipopolysaccharide biosynthesis glycosyltransferase